LDRPVNDHADETTAEARGVPRKAGMAKEREMKEDGRYIIFYSFDDEETREGGDS
jgi:hypothetical protein